MSFKVLWLIFLNMQVKVSFFIGFFDQVVLSCRVWYSQIRCCVVLVDVIFLDDVLDVVVIFKGCIQGFQYQSSYIVIMGVVIRIFVSYVVLVGGGKYFDFIFYDV